MFLGGCKSGHRALLGAATAIMCAGAAPSVSAEPADAAGAELLFRAGKERMAAKDYARACPKLADSYRLDPATGTLLALAMCHERSGKLASAWAEYTDAASRSKREGRADRERAAREKASALESRLSYLTISAPRAVSELSGLEITRNGAAVGAGILGTPVPVDGGTFTIAASAPGRKAWSAQVTIAQSERHTISVPALEENASSLAATKAAPAAKAAPEPATAPVVAKVAPSAPEADRGESSFGALAAATIVGGVVSLGIGTGYMLSAMKKNEDSKTGCDGDRCNSSSTQDRLDARAYGNVATIGFLAGGTLIAIGTTLYIVGSSRSAPRTSTTSATSATLEATPLIGPGGIGGVLRGTF